MSQDPNQAEAGAGSEGAEAAKAAAEISLNTPGKEQNFDERLDGATSQADVLKLIDDAKAGRLTSAKSAGGQTAEEQAAAEAAAVQAKADADAAEAEKKKTEAAEAAAGGEQTEEEKAAAEAAAVQAKADADAAEAAKKKQEDDEEEGKLPNRIRISDFAEVDKLAITLKKAALKQGETITFAEAEKRAMAALGLKPETAKPSGEEADTGLPKTLAEVDAKIAELKLARSKARAEDLDFKAADRLDNEIDALKEHKSTLRAQTERQATAEQTAYNTAFDAAQGRAAGLYDFVKTPDSAGFKRMAEIDRQLEESKDPLFNAADKPLVIAQMVARELQIAPKSPTAGKPVVAAKPAASAQGKKTVPPVASGASRTTTATTQGAELSKKIDALRTPADLENFVQGLGG
jgi:hypothetical protein